MADIFVLRHLPGNLAIVLARPMHSLFLTACMQTNQFALPAEPLLHGVFSAQAKGRSREQKPFSVTLKAHYLQAWNVGNW